MFDKNVNFCQIVRFFYEKITNLNRYNLFHKYQKTKYLAKINIFVKHQTFSKQSKSLAENRNVDQKSNFLSIFRTNFDFKI